MNKTTLFPALMTAAVITLCGITAPTAVLASSVNVQINGYLPAPPGVRVYQERGRPYYFEDHRRVYVERDRGHHRWKRHHGHEYRDHEGHGHGHGR